MIVPRIYKVIQIYKEKRKMGERNTFYTKKHIWPLIRWSWSISSKNLTMHIRSQCNIIFQNLCQKLGSLTIPSVRKWNCLPGFTKTICKVVNCVDLKTSIPYCQQVPSKAYMQDKYLHVCTRDPDKRDHTSQFRIATALKIPNAHSQENG